MGIVCWQLFHTGQDSGDSACLLHLCRVHAWMHPISVLRLYSPFQNDSLDNFHWSWLIFIFLFNEPLYFGGCSFSLKSLFDDRGNLFLIMTHLWNMENIFFVFLVFFFFTFLSVNNWCNILCSLLHIYECIVYWVYANEIFTRITSSIFYLLTFFLRNIFFLFCSKCQPLKLFIFFFILFSKSGT